MKKWLLAITGFLGLGLSGACGETVENGGAGGSEAGGNGPPGTFADVQAIFDAHCTNCHDAQIMGIPSYPSLSLVAADAYAALVDKPADQVCGGQRVVPGAPEKSYLMLKIGPGNPCSGDHMPRPFEIGPRIDLSSAELETVRSWIAAGALQ
jgi:hypothetical protein